MSRTSFFATFLLFGLFTQNILFGQDLNSNYAALKQKIVEVKIDQTTFQPSFEVLDAEKGKLNYTLTEVDEKGKSKKEGFEFYLSDIDKNTIVRNVSGKKMIVSISINNNQKFIKYFVDNNHDAYVSKIDILVQNADEGQKIMDLLKASIPMIKSAEKTWNSNTEALNWLKSNIGEVKTKSGVSVQTFTFGERKDYLIQFTSVKTDVKGVNTTDKYEFNALDLNKNGIALKISGAQLTINVESKGGDKFFKHFKNNVFHGFDNSFEIEALDIDQARNVISALSVAHLKSKAQFKSFSSLESALEFIKGNSADYKFDDKTFKQKFDFKMGNGTKATISVNESDSKGKSVDIVNYIYLDDIEINSLKLKISGPKVLLLGTIKGNMDFVKVTKDVEIQNYDHEFEWLFTDIETAREVMDALIYSIKASETKPMTWSSVSEAISFLSNNVKGETIQKDMYKLYFTGESLEPFRCEYTRNKRDEKSSVVDYRFVFYPFTLDAASVKIKSSGKFLNINALVAKKQSLVKTFKDNKQESYDNELTIMAFDSKQAKDIAEAIKYLANNAKSPEKDWGDKRKSMDFVKANIAQIKGEGIEIKQKIDFVNDDACKINFTVNTTDDKGKTLEEIFEFSLSDMNKMMVEYKVSGKMIQIKLVCKNQEKFIKVYKNGQQQSFNNDVIILEDDVDKAKNIADALRNAIIKCEQ